MFELALAAMWFIQSTDGQTMVSNIEPDPAKLVNRWDNARILYNAGVNFDNNYEWEIAGGVLRKKPVVVDAPTPDSVATGEIDQALRTRANDSSITDLEYARLLRLKYMTPAQRVIEWGKVK